ncbi:uncharacterized protein LOC131293169 [Anopheles ziemanni]|uniref:uncharacterized protein LOC131264077 n=1 Tax=Anopheles coustani TaxID=139045 RepID=UPI0026583D6E|nr:uncharacterized protein LOC131264077 [Anopheles coustani]XP_058177231.1 uncharacterized protein LOC131293169 [Anopheles ziemanni]
MQTDSLVRIPSTAWEQLRDLFVQDWPRHEIAFNNLQNYISWAARDPQTIGTLEVYSLNGTWIENGTYIIIDNTNVFMYTLDTSEQTLRRMLQLLDWHRSYLMNMCLYRDTVAEVYRLNQLDVEYESFDSIYYLTRTMALNFHFEVPLGMSLKRIAPQFAAFIYNQWVHKVAGTQNMIEQMLRMNDSMGLFLDGAREPLAWCIRTQNGAIGLLGVVAKRKGFGSLVVKALARQLAHQGHNVYASVSFTKEASMKLFEKLGFQVVGKVNWIKNCGKQ